MILKYIQTIIKKHLAWIPLMVLVFLLGLSWVYLEIKKDQSREILHSVLQNKVQTVISNYAIDKHPNITEVIFRKIWTKETSSPSEIQVFFSYTLVEDSSSQKSSLDVDGEALLTVSNDEDNLWVLSDFKVTDQLLDFDEPMVIKASPPESSQ